MLAEIDNWFTEGFDTADLKDAKALLDGTERLKDARRLSGRPRRAAVVVSAPFGHG